MPCRAPISAGPRPPESTVRAGGTASGAASSAEQRPRPDDADGGDDRERDDEQPDEGHPRGPLAEQDGEGPLADGGVAVRCRAGC